jgi:transcriptional regulator with PAS, ATPase and Fis domain
MITVFKNFIFHIESLLGSYPIVLIAHILSLGIKILIAFSLIRKLRNTGASIALRSGIMLLLVIMSASITDLAWIIKMIKEVFIPSLDYSVTLFFIRIAWGALALQYQALALFINSLLEKKYKVKKYEIILASISLLIFMFFICLSFYDINCPTIDQRPRIEAYAQKIGLMYVLANLLLSSALFIIRTTKSYHLPRILRKHLRIFIKFLILPCIISEFIQIYPFDFALTWITNNYTVVTLTTLLLTYTIYHCIRKVMGLRFLNFQSQVQSTTNVNFINNFKDVLEQLSHVTTIQELQHIIQNFFKESFHIPVHRVRLYIRNLDATSDTKQDLSHEAYLVENFIGAHTDNCNINELLQKSKVLIADELAFTNFYEERDDYKKLLSFIETINADIFIPIHEGKTIVAYIIVERYARIGNMTEGEDFYSQAEQDQMVVLASYLGNIINLLQNRNLHVLIQQEKELREEIFQKHQEINQYKESMRLFLQHSSERKIGIMFYKNRNFIFGNQTAKEMIGINVNTHQGHPLAKALKTIAQQVLEYKAPQATLTHDTQGNKLVLSGILNLEQNNVIITLYYPEVSDLIRRKIDLLKDPTEWDYLLYLETTQSGKLVNQLIPGSTETLLNFKIELLKAALSKKATLLSMPDEDLLPTVEVLHHISLRENLHILNLQGPVKNLDIAIKLFGINSLFGSNAETPLLEKLNNTGTLFIKNIHYLDLETQEHLAEYIKFGVYRIFKSDQKATSNARIICSSTLNLQTLVQEGKFSQALFNELKATTLIMPSLLTLPEQELDVLAQDLTEQTLKTVTFKNLLELTDKERQKILQARPASIHELKTKIQQLLINKSKKNHIYQETEFDPAYDIGDPELAEAARLGKHALKDPRIMALLWNKFKNQNKIAQFLDVNRSSVNRRCKEYNLF